MDLLRAEFAEVACWPPATAEVAFFGPFLPFLLPLRLRLPLRRFCCPAEETEAASPEVSSRYQPEV